MEESISADGGSGPADTLHRRRRVALQSQNHGTGLCCTMRTKQLTTDFTVVSFQIVDRFLELNGLWCRRAFLSLRGKAPEARAAGGGPGWPGGMTGQDAAGGGYAFAQQPRAVSSGRGASAGGKYRDPNMADDRLAVKTPSLPHYTLHCSPGAIHLVALRRRSWEKRASRWHVARPSLGTGAGGKGGEVGAGMERLGRLAPVRGLGGCHRAAAGRALRAACASGGIHGVCVERPRGCVALCCRSGGRPQLLCLRVHVLSLPPAAWGPPASRDPSARCRGGPAGSIACVCPV